MVSENLVRGHGTGTFKRNYLIHQADYFSSTEYTKKELLLADNTHYAFNDYYQFLIEHGLFFLLLVLLLAFYVIFVGLKKIKAGQTCLLYLLSFSSIVITMVAAIFNHIFEQPVYQSVWLISAFIILKPQVKPQYYLYLFTIIYVILQGIIIYNAFNNQLFHYNHYEKKTEAQDLYRAGYLNKSLVLLKEIYPTYKEDPFYLEFYGRLLFQSGQYQNSLKNLKSAISIAPNNELVKILGDCHYQLGNLKESEKCYKLAINMVPNRFGTRYALFNFYLLTNQNTKALKIGKAILNLPKKIPSSRVDMLLNIVSEKIQTIKP